MRNKLCPASRGMRSTFEVYGRENPFRAQHIWNNYALSQKARYMYFVNGCLETADIYITCGP